jgi:hypothetical protein
VSGGAGGSVWSSDTPPLLWFERDTWGILFGRHRDAKEKCPQRKPTGIRLYKLISIS